MTQTESNQKVTKTDNHAAGYYKNYVLGCKLICMRFINSLYNKIVRSIALLDNIAILFVQVNFHTSQSFGGSSWSMS